MPSKKRPLKTPQQRLSSTIHPQPLSAERRATSAERRAPRAEYRTLNATMADAPPSYNYTPVYAAVPASIASFGIHGAPPAADTEVIQRRGNNAPAPVPAAAPMDRKGR